MARENCVWTMVGRTVRICNTRLRPMGQKSGGTDGYNLKTTEFFVFWGAVVAPEEGMLCHLDFLLGVC